MPIAGTVGDQSPNTSAITDSFHIYNYMSENLSYVLSAGTKCVVDKT